MILILYTLFSRTGIAAFIVLFLSAFLHYSYTYKSKGLITSLIVSIIFGVLIVLATRVRNRQAMGWDFGLLRGLCVFIAVVFVFIATVIPNIIRLPFSFQYIRGWITGKDPFSFYNFLPALSITIICILFGFKLISFTVSSMFTDAIHDNSLFFIKTFMRGKFLSNKHLISRPHYPLHLAVNMGHDEIVDHLLKNGADVNKVNELDRTPVDELFDQPFNSEFKPEHVKCALLLIEHGVFLDEEIILKLSELPDHGSIIKGIYKRIYSKIEKGDTSNGTFKSELAGFFKVALEKKYNEQLRAILSKKCYINFVNEGGRSLLAEAFDAANNEIAMYLLDNGAECPSHSQDESIFLPLHAIGKVDSLVASRYLELCGSTDIDKPWYETTALISAAEEQNTSVMKLLLQNGANPKAHGINGKPPLFTAVRYDNYENIRLLCDAGADPNYKSYYGNALFELCEQDTEFYKGAKILISYGVSCTTMGYRGTALHMAAEKGHCNIGALLLDNGVNVDIPDTNGSTPLMYALGGARVEMVAFLLGKGADVRKKNNLGETPDMYLEKYSYKYFDKTHLAKVMDILIDYGAEPRNLPVP